MSEQPPLTLEEIRAQIKRVRITLPSDSPLQAIAFQLDALTGEIEAYEKARENKAL